MASKGRRFVRYLDTIYQTNWVEAIYGKDVFGHGWDAGRPGWSPACPVVAVGMYVYDQVVRAGELHVIDGFFHELRRFG